MFESVTIFVLASEETVLLRQTIRKIQSCCSPDDVDSIVIVLKSETCLSNSEADKLIDDKSTIKIKKYVQKSDNIVNCIAELPPIASGSHFVIMASDMEMDPESLKVFIQQAKLYPERIICAAKWHKSSAVEGYGIIHEIGSRIMNNFVSLLYGKRVFDPFSIYQIYPVSLYKKIKFINPSMFPYEYTLIPLRLGFEYAEIPTIYKKRTLGESSFNALALVIIALNFCTTAVKIRLTPKGDLYGTR